MTQQRDSLSDVVAGRVQQLRKDKGWSLARLAEQCAAAGAPHLNVNVLTNLLTRRERRRGVTVDEAAALADALSVPLSHLLPKVLEPIDDPLKLLPLVFKSREQAEQMRATLLALAQLTEMIRDQYGTEERDNG